MRQARRGEGLAAARPALTPPARAPEADPLRARADEAGEPALPGERRAAKAGGTGEEWVGRSSMWWCVGVSVGGQAGRRGDARHARTHSC